MKAISVSVLVVLCLLEVPTHAGPTTTTDSAKPVRQKSFDPWLFTNSDPNRQVMPYVSDGKRGGLVTVRGSWLSTYQAGDYVGGILRRTTILKPVVSGAPGKVNEKYDLYHGVLTSGKAVFGPNRDWPKIWNQSDITIGGDPEAQQVTHANMFYLLSSTYPGSTNSIPPFGLSSSGYNGHVFWDAEVWMLPALIVQHPAEARGIIDYRFKRLAQAKTNAHLHGFAGAEYPWESADTGVEVAPAYMQPERHITADVGWAAWQYYLWTGDKAYLVSEGWPILQSTANYWVSRATLGADQKYHIHSVISPDEDAGIVDDDAWTNAVAQANLRAAIQAARIIGQPVDPRWAEVASGMYLAYDAVHKIIAENNRPQDERFVAKQADTLLLLYPLNRPCNARLAGRMLDFYHAHVSPDGPAMTSSIEAIVAARLGRAQLSLNLFHDSYRPFVRGPWDSFSETAKSVGSGYFCTGMGGCLQSVLMGFAGLQVVSGDDAGQGIKIATDQTAALYCDPHLPPGWSGLTVKGVCFHGQMFDISVGMGNRVMWKKVRK